MKTHKDEIIKEKITGNYKLIGIRRTFEDGRIIHGFGLAKRGDKRFEVAWGHDERQVRTSILRHHAAFYNPNILIYS